MMTIHGRQLIDLGFQKGPEPGRALNHVNALARRGEVRAAWVAASKPSLQAAAPRFDPHSETPGMRSAGIGQAPLS